jgi:glutathione peroxidase
MTINYVADQGQRKSIYEINLNSVDGSEESILSKYIGKVTLIINVTGHCGNAPQFGIIEEIYRKYKDKGFEVLAVPTNDFCGPGITYGIYEKGITHAAMSQEYAVNEWDVTYTFSELVVSREDRPDDNEILNRRPHELYENLNPGGEGSPMYGNFEKFLVDKSGKVIYRFPNSTLLNFGYESGICDTPEVERQILEEKIQELLDLEWDGNLYAPE